MITRLSFSASLAITIALLMTVSPAQAKNSLQLVIKGTSSRAMEANLRALIDPDRYPCHPDPLQQTLIEQRTRKLGAEALQALGYFSPRLALQWQAKQPQHCATLVLTIEPGTPVLITRIDIRLLGDARHDAAFTDAIDHAELKMGERLQQDRYSRLKNHLQQLLIDRGYVEGTLSVHRLEVDSDQHTAQVIIEVDSGPRYRFGNITIDDSSGLNPALVHAYVSATSATPFDSRQLLAGQQALMGSGYFSTVRMERGPPDTVTHTLPVTLITRPRNHWALLSGIGISTDTGPRLRVGVENRQLNRFGHKADIEAKVSSIQQGIGAGYQIPLADPVNEKLQLNTSYLHETTDTSDSESLKVGSNYIKQLPSGWVITTSLNYLHETYEVADQIDRDNLIMPGLQLEKTHADNRLRPRHGWTLGAKVRGAAEPAGSTANFLQLEGWAKLVLPLPWQTGRVLLRGRAAMTDVSDVLKLPATLRYFAGGDNSVRGYAYQSLGPRNGLDEVIGGRDLLVGSVEFDQLVTPHWAFALFSDAGNAFNTFNDYEILHSIGAGVRWNSPLGPVRLDVARGLTSDRPWRLHLSMGPDL